MQKINNPKQRGFRLLSITDSVTGRSSKTNFVGKTTRCFVEASYIDNCPILSDYVQIFRLDDNEMPEPKEGWCYALGFF